MRHAAHCSSRTRSYLTCRTWARSRAFRCGWRTAPSPRGSPRRLKRDACHTPHTTQIAITDTTDGTHSEFKVSKPIDESKTVLKVGDVGMMDRTGVVAAAAPELKNVEYEIGVETSTVRGAGTDANVSIVFDISHVMWCDVM